LQLKRLRTPDINSSMIIVVLVNDSYLSIILIDNTFIANR
jgi:hypothetical protein